MVDNLNDFIRFCAEMEKRTMKNVDGHIFNYSVARNQGRAETFHYVAEILSEIVDGNMDSANKMIAELWNRG